MLLANRKIRWCNFKISPHSFKTCTVTVFPLSVCQIEWLVSNEPNEAHMKVLQFDD